MSFTDDVTLTTAYGWTNMALNSQAAGHGIRTRRANAIMDLDERCCELTKEKVKLEDENAVLKAVMTGLLDRCEALRRVVGHLETAWQPRGADPTAPAFGLQPMVSEKQRAVAADPTWPTDKERMAADWTNWGKAQVPPRGRRR